MDFFDFLNPLSFSPIGSLFGSQTGRDILQAGAPIAGAGIGALGGDPATGMAFGNMLGSGAGAISARQQAERESLRNERLQREFAQMGIRWKVEDAKAAGIHPLAALGAQTQSFTPFTVGDSSSAYLSQMGQDLSRAFSAKQTDEERALKSAQLASINLDLEHKALQNKLLQNQITSSQVPPALPSDTGMSSTLLSGQSNAKVVVKPSESTHRGTDRPASQAGNIPDYGFVRTPTGLSIVPSSDVKQRIEDQLVPELMWSFRNQILPNFAPDSFRPSTKDFPLPEGQYWDWDVAHQEFRARSGQKVRSIDMRGRR